jgi:hypothetical protein
MWNDSNDDGGCEEYAVSVLAEQDRVILSESSFVEEAKGAFSP